MLITDVHVHIYDADTPARPWPHEPGRSPAPSKHPRGFTAEEMLGAMGAVGVDRAVIVPPVWAGEDNTPGLEAAARYPDRFAVMGRIDPYTPGAEERLEHWLEQPGMVGIRMSGRWGTKETQARDALEDPAIEWYWAACERLGIPVAVLAGQSASRLAPIAARHPDLRLLIDHSGMRGGETLAEALGGLDDLRALARSPHVYIKAGSAPNASRQAYPFADVHDYLRGIRDAFGARRMLWEADITQLGTKNTYAECLRLWQEALPFLTADEREWILGGAAAEVLNWPEPA
ncbi:MAG: amidohydrolase [Dehalococcoidia bacterium]|nr:amidohydrolase [Dehalococcoidia bacterium]